MDRVTFSSLASNIVVIGIDGEIRALEPGQVPASGELVITEVSDISQLNFEQIAPDGSSINVTDDITALIEAIAAGEDPAQLEGDFEPAAGESDGSSPQSTGAIDRTGAEALANTDFETVGTVIPLSETQELSLLEFINQQIIIPAQVIVQDISSPTINEGNQASFEVTLDQPTQQETEVTLSLSDDSATGGADYDNSVITITFEDGSTDQINVGEDGTFSVSIPIGDESFVITVDTIDDDVFEGNETFTLSGGTENQPEPVTGLATITDDGTGPGEEPDDDRPTVASVSDTTVNEGEEAVLEVTLSNPSTSETTVNMTLSDGTAEGGLDYTNTSVTITFEDNSTQIVNVNPDGSFAVTVPANEVSYNVTINTIDDDLFEGTETFTLSGSTENQNDTTSGTGTIVDDGSGPGPNPDDDRPTVASISDTTVNEGDLAILDVTLSNLSTTDTVVSMNLDDSSAEGGIDYTNTSVTITFEDNSTQVVNVNPDGSFDVSVPADNVSYSVTISTIDDDLFEGSETFTLSGNTGNQAIPQTGIGTIIDDGTGPGPDPDGDRPTVSISDAGTINEGDTANFVVSLINASEDPVEVQLDLNLGDTEAGDLGTLEYNTGSGWVAVPVDGVVTVPAGLTEFDVRIASIDDEVYEGPENFTVDVTGLGPVLGTDTGTATIVDDGTGPESEPDDDRPTVSISDVGTINEGDTANFVVSLSNASEAPVEVQLDLNLGDTEVGDLGTLEYNTGSGWVAVPIDGVVTVPAGLTEFDVRIDSIDDEVYEGPENFTVDVTGLGPVQGSDTGTATIVDDGTGPDPDPDDDRPTVSISDAGTINEGETANFVVLLTNASEAPVEVQLGLNLGDTEAGDLGTLEYNTGSGWVAVPVDGVVTVPAGLTEFDVRVATIDDEVFEGPEEFSVSVTGLDSVQGSDSGSATIVDDNTGPSPDPDDDRPTVSISDAGTINEGDTANFVVSLTNASEAPVEVQLDLNLGDTEAGDLSTLEYNTGSGWVAVPVDGVVTVPAGLTEFDVRIASIDDEVYEGPENFTVDVTGLGPVQGTDTGSATIVDDGTGPDPDPDDDRPTVSISDAGTINEGDTANFVVSLTNASESPVEVQLDINLGDTEAGDLGTLEYNTGSGWVAVPVNGVVSVPAGLTEFDVRIASIDDEVYEGPENFTVDVTGLGPVQGTDTGTATIVDDGTGPGPDPDDDRPGVTISDAGVINEGDTANFVVTLANASEAPVEVQLDLNLGDTEAGDLGTLEYNTGSGWVAVPVDGVVTVPAGLTEFDVRIASIDDEVYEGPENFMVDVTGLGPVQGSDTGTATIVDDGTGPDPDPDDDRPTVSISDAGTINEGETANFVVSLTNASEAPVEVQLGLNLGDTEAGDLGTLEYNTGSGWIAVPIDGVVTVPAGLTEFDVRIDSIDDEVYEGPENFTVDVTGLGPVQGTDTGTATIVDDGTGPDPDPDDDRPTVSISDAGTINEGDTADFVVSLTNESEVAVQVQLTLNAGDTGVGDLGTLEYNTGSGWVAVPNDGLVTVPAGSTQFDVRIDTLNDAVFEQDEDFSVSVVGVGPVLGSDVGNATIIDNDAPPAISDVIDAVVSEEGLTDGIPDSTGSPTDTTNSASFSGSFTVGDPDTANVSVVLSGPNTLTSGGEPVSWAWNSNTQTLTASTASLAVVATVVLTEPAVSGQGTWGYTITLLEPLDHPVNDVEDLIDFDLQISVSDGQTTSSQSMNVVVEDDCPHVPTSSQAVDVSLTDIPEILTGNISFVGNESDAFSRTFGDVEVTALGFLSNESTDLGAAEINQTSSGIGVKSVGNNGYPLANEVDYRFANDTGVSEQLIINLGDKIAFGAEIEFEKMFGGELEEGLASFYRDGVLIAQQSFSSDAASGDYAANFSVLQGGFDKVILEATGNGNGPNTADNSDFTVKSITFTGADSVIPIATAEGNLGALYGADGPGSIVLNGAESGLETLDDEAISVTIDPQNPNRLVGEANGELAFEVQLTPSTGKWEFFQYVPLTSPSGDGDIDFSYTITDNDGDSKAGNFAVNPYAPPIVEGVTLNVSEEGLGNAIADDFALNGFMDTTDSTLDMDQLTLGQTVDSVALNVPTANLTSNGEAITWALSNNDQLLVGSADGEEVIKVSVNDTGAISTELLGPIDHPDTSGEDSLNIEVPVVVSNALGLTNSAIANVVIEDDSPDSTSIVHDVVAETKESANVQLIMDVSGSMRTGNRLQIMKDSATQLLNQYESIGQTRVQIIKYSGSATTYAIAGATWLTVDEAKAYIDTLTAGGATNYNRAINEAKGSWDDAGKLPSASNVSYFLSDGQPNPASSFINDARENSWIDHLTDSDNQITALAYGMGVNLMPDQLDRVAYDGFLNQDLDGVVVPDVNQLPPVMLQSVIQPVGGNLMYTTSPDTGIGADGGYISEVEHDGVTYLFDGADLTVVDNNNDISHAFDDITMLLTIYIDSKHTLEVDLNDGAYAFYGAVGDIVETLDFDYVLTDNDGDQSENTLQFVIDENGGVNAASGGAANIIEAEVDVSHDILIGNDNEADIFRWVNDSLDSGTDLVRGFERDLDILDLNQVVEDAGHNTIEELLNSIDLNVDGEDLSLEITHNEGNSIQTIVIEKGASEFSDLIIGNMDFERDVLSALTKVNLDS
ncbi:Calx-beta domain-containing protein [Vibrio campbellii]|uniref:Calx-beta domain-containing protein n=1 Tax=Vibrio campbellii TaxID=680 RepID=UPI0038CD599E